VLPSLSPSEVVLRAPSGAPAAARAAPVTGARAAAAGDAVGPEGGENKQKTEDRLILREEESMAHDRVEDKGGGARDRAIGEAGGLNAARGCTRAVEWCCGGIAHPPTCLPLSRGSMFERMSGTHALAQCAVAHQSLVPRGRSRESAAT
jgi:hypothetical protein